MTKCVHCFQLLTGEFVDLLWIPAPQCSMLCAEFSGTSEVILGRCGQTREAQCTRRVGVAPLKGFRNLEPAFVHFY